MGSALRVHNFEYCRRGTWVRGFRVTAPPCVQLKLNSRGRKETQKQDTPFPCKVSRAHPRNLNNLARIPEAVFMLLAFALAYPNP